MKIASKFVTLTGLALTLFLGESSLVAQNTNATEQGGRRNRGQGGPGGGNFDPEQMRQRMMERTREQLGVKDDAEWKIISERIEKVTAARREVGGRGGFGAFGGGRGGGPGGPGGGGPGGGGRGGFGGEPSPEAQALQTAIENNASADDIKSKLAKYRESQKEKEANLAKTQEDLRKVLTGKQEATAVLAGLLK